jgi:hypothetical protein
MQDLKIRDISYIKNYRQVRKIFGKTVCIECLDVDLRPHLLKELSLYPAGELEQADYILEILSNDEIKKRIKEFEDTEYICITAKTGVRYFTFHEGKLSHILFSLNKPINKLHGWVQRFRNIGFNRREERIGQIIHEQVLVPSVLFDEKVVPVHSSAVEFNNQVVLFGGHGGVGKTSLELELCFYRAAHFIADDISVVSIEGKVFPNLSYPKIYGYNVEGHPEIKKRVIDGSDFMDRLQWKYQFLKGPNKVRRRISPALLYQNYESEPVQGNRYMILNRYEGDILKVEKVSSDEAAGVTIKILKSELSGILNQLDHQENFKVSRYKKEAIIERWSMNLSKLLSSFVCEVVFIPQGIPHQEFKEKMMDVFS